MKTKNKDFKMENSWIDKDATPVLANLDKETIPMIKLIR
jgi:hypothetical protein